jgi:hypothetical protein
MFCPRCRAPTEVREGYLYCTATATDFSQVARQELTAVAESLPVEPEPSNVRWGGCFTDDRGRGGRDLPDL